MNREINNNNNNNNMSSSGDIIDLCASSSEDEEDEDQVQIVLPATTRVVAHKQRNDAATLKNIVVTPDQVKQNDDNISSSSSSSEGRHSKPKRPRSLFPTTKNKPPSRNDDCSSSDSDSDDPLLSFQAFKPVKSVPKQAADPFPITTSTSTSTLRSKQPPSLKTKNPTSTKNSKPNTSTRKMETGSWTSETPRIHNPYKIKQFKQPTIYSSICGSAPSPNFPDLGSAHYEDVRAKYILAFWKYAQSLEHASFNLGRLDQFCKRINALALSEYPIRSLEEYCFRFTKGSTMETTHNLLEALQAGNVDNYNAHPFGSNDGRYYSIAEACLESMLSHVELIASSFGYPNPSTLPDSQVQTLLKEKACWVFLNDLIPKIDDKLQPICPGRLTRHNDDDNGASFYLDPSTRSTEFKQLERLQRTPSGEDLPYIKAHKQRGETCYELTTLGFQTAVRVRSRTFPAAPGPYRTSNLPTPCDGICLVVDTREGGGPQNKLHQMCNKLDSLKIPYMVCRLKIGDYCFMTSDGKMFPILVERKSIQDVAQSIYDGRWTNQKLNMYQGQFVFGYEHSRMLYVIEGKESTQQLTGGYIGQRHLNVTRDQLDQAVHNLQEEGFEVLRTQ